MSVSEFGLKVLCSLLCVSQTSDRTTNDNVGIFRNLFYYPLSLKPENHFVRQQTQKQLNNSATYRDKGYK